MNKLLLILMIGLTSLSANSGDDIYKAKCSMCHTQNMPADMTKMKAPPMSKISAHLKNNLQTKEKFLLFVKDYIKNPSREKGFCMQRAYKRFRTMPPIGKGMTEEERETISLWLYEHYQKPQKMMKCGGSKCGNAKPSSVHIPTH